MSITARTLLNTLQQMPEEMLDDPIFVKCGFNRVDIELLVPDVERFWQIVIANEANNPPKVQPEPPTKEVA